MRKLSHLRSGGAGVSGPARLRLSALFIVVLVLTGCSASEPTSPYTAEYTELGDLNAQRIDRTERIVACLADAGFPGAEIQEDGSTAIELTDEQMEGYNQAASDCLLEACPACGQPPSSETLTRLFHLQVEAARCLTEAGFDTSDAPSLQSYLGSPAESRWSPHRDAAQALASSGRMNEILESCPDPETFVTYW